MAGSFLCFLSYVVSLARKEAAISLAGSFAMLCHQRLQVGHHDCLFFCQCILLAEKFQQETASGLFNAS
jgi:hypothetical protein